MYIIELIEMVSNSYYGDFLISHQLLLCDG